MDIRHRFDAAFQTWIPPVLAEIDAVVPRDGTLGPMLRYHLDTGGKRLRAVLPFITAETLDADRAILVPFAAACEMLHNATLVHDDLQDGDVTRRGRPTVWARFGAPQAINLGDAMFYWTLQLVARLDRDPTTREAVAALVLAQTLRVIDGQEREFHLKSGTPSLADYFAMVEGKTSGLFALPLSGAARLCGADDATVQALDDAARHLGVLFQVQDDLLDLYGDKGRDGVGSDIGEGKRSILVVHALGHAPDAPRLREILDRSRDATTPTDVAWAADLFRETGSVRFALDEIDRRAHLAASPDLPPALRDLVLGLADLFQEPLRGRI